jgi:ribose transport system ATP-binding protein
MSEAPRTGDGVPLLQMRGIVKLFPGVRALDGVDLDVVAGQVHCLLGQNGAGKSTLIKVLSGAHQPDGGTIEWRGEPVTLGTPQAALRLGIATIYQELDLVPGLSVADNIHLGREESRSGFVRRRIQLAAARDVLNRLGHSDIPANREVGRLSPAGQQIVSLARALARDARVIVMDEPSAMLAYDEVSNLFRVIRELTAAGVAVVYISHRLEEIRTIGDVVTVLKDGRTVATGLPARTTPTRTVVSLMTGRDVEHVFPPRRRAPGTAELLRVERLTLAGAFNDVSLTVHAGEIVGIAGLVGAGRSEVLETIYGARRRTSGTVAFEGRPLRPGSVGSAVRSGLGLAPEERKSQGLILGESVARNVSLASLPGFARGGWLDRGREQRDAERLAADLDVRPPGVARAVRTLSGGNQQKVVLARWLVGPDPGAPADYAGSGGRPAALPSSPIQHRYGLLRRLAVHPTGRLARWRRGRPDQALRSTRLLLLDEPTRGVDVGARTEIYGLIRGLADDGIGVLLVSSDVPEVLGLADRVLVMREGRVVHEAPASELDEHRVLDLVMEGSAA